MKHSTMRQLFKVLLLIAFVSEAFALKPSVGVIDFKNNTGNKGLNFLKSSIAEQISTKLISNKDLNIVERLQFKSLLKEMELQQSGLFSEDDISKNRKKLKADFLIMGAYVGNSQKLHVTIKLVNVDSGKVVSASEVTGSIDDIFEKIKMSTGSIVAIITGKDKGYLTLNSNPDEVTVYLNGNKIGTTPIVHYTLLIGNYELRLARSKYRDVLQDISISKDETLSLNETLTNSRIQNRPVVSTFSGYLIAKEGFSENTFLFGGSVGYSYLDWLFSLEYWGSLPFEYNYTFKVPYNTVSEIRSNNVHMISLHADYTFYNLSDYIAPYFGTQAGLMILNENNIKADYFSNKSKSYLSLALGAILGLEFFPLSRFSGFFEARYLYSVMPAKRKVVKDINFLGQVNSIEVPYNFTALSLNLGIRFRF